MARFQAGQKLLVIAFTNDDPRSVLRSTGLPHRFGVDKEVKFHLKELEVLEHHKVNWDYDPADKEPDCDGFVLADANGDIWHNQYPRASYGQISTEADYYFEFANKKKDGTKCPEWNVLFEEAEKNAMPLQSLLAARAFDRMKEGVVNLRGDERGVLLAKILEDIEAEAKKLGYVFREEQVFKTHPDIKHWVCVKELENA